MHVILNVTGPCLFLVYYFWCNVISNHCEPELLLLLFAKYGYIIYKGLCGEKLSCMTIYPCDRHTFVRDECLSGHS